MPPAEVRPGLWLRTVSVEGFSKSDNQTHRAPAKELWHERTGDIRNDREKQKIGLTYIQNA